jgi:hypothetical protein
VASDSRLLRDLPRLLMTEAATGASCAPVMVHPVLVNDVKLEPTSPLIVEVVQVSVPTVPIGFVPSAA